MQMIVKYFLINILKLQKNILKLELFLALWDVDNLGEFVQRPIFRN